MMGWGFPGGMGLPQRFEEQYHCYSVAYADKAHLESGDKILLPPSALDMLARLNVDYPMLFNLQNPSKNTSTHCGVMEFSAEEGSCYVPFWMMQNLLMEEGGIITVVNVSLPKATFVKLKPQHVDFLEISNPRVVLEHALRKFSCVTKGDVIQLPYNNKNYHFELMEVKPQDAVCVIETDCNVDFDAPVGYKEPERPTANGASGAAKEDDSKPTANGQTLGSKLDDDDDEEDEKNDEDDGPKTRIVDGQIVRPEDDEMGLSSSAPNGAGPKESLLAPKTGATGLQQNSAVPTKAPGVGYWAVQAGDGARLDGKNPTTLKDREGNEVDIRKMRAEAAAKRAEAALARGAVSMAATLGRTVAGEKVEPTKDAVQLAQKMEDGGAPVSKRKARVGSKFSRLKQKGAYAFDGAGHSLDK